MITKRQLMSSLMSAINLKTAFYLCVTQNHDGVNQALLKGEQVLHMGYGLCNGGSTTQWADKVFKRDALTPDAPQAAARCLSLALSHPAGLTPPDSLSLGPNRWEGVGGHAYKPEEQGSHYRLVGL